MCITHTHLLIVSVGHHYGREVGQRGLPRPLVKDTDHFVVGGNNSFENANFTL